MNRQEAIAEVEKGISIQDAHQRVFSLVDMRIFANRIIDLLVENNEGGKNVE